MADLLGVSPAQIGKMQNVEKNAIPAVIEAVESGEISISTANEIAKMDTDSQEQLLQQSDLSSISPKDLKKIQEEKVDTNINFSEMDDEPDTEDSEVDTSINFSETDDKLKIDETAKVDTNSNLSSFIYENYYELEAIFEAYISLTSDDDEAKLLEEFLPLLHEVKEVVRNKVRFGF